MVWETREMVVKATKRVYLCDYCGKYMHDDTNFMNLDGWSISMPKEDELQLGDGTYKSCFAFCSRVCLLDWARANISKKEEQE